MASERPIFSVKTPSTRPTSRGSVRNKEGRGHSFINAALSFSAGPDVKFRSVELDGKQIKLNIWSVTVLRVVSNES